MIKISTFLQNWIYCDDFMNIFVCDAMFEALWWPQGWYYFFEKTSFSWKVLISSKNVLDFTKNGQNKNLSWQKYIFIFYFSNFLSFLIWKHFAQLLVIRRLPVFLSEYVFIIFWIRYVIWNIAAHRRTFFQNTLDMSKRRGNLNFTSAFL